jgi:hypothetical protein
VINKKSDEIITQDINLDKLEKKAWRVNFEDGLFEIYLGFLITFLGSFTFVADLVPLAVYYTVILVITLIGGFIFMLAKKFISKPRIGKVKYGKKRKRRKITIVLVDVAYIILLFIMLFVINSNLVNRDLIPDYLYTLLIALLFITLPLCIIAYLIQFPRFYFTAVLFGTGIFLSELLTLYITYPLSNAVAFSIVGGIVMLLGFYYLMKFIKKYPLTEKEV